VVGVPVIWIVWFIVGMVLGWWDGLHRFDSLKAECIGGLS